ncbi:SCO family protein [Streptomyces sp. NPDC059853]|uniref:SCO family protein n=1 Tax=Streptomyces sp. NPDC059853 TaxID=3346973 RepID=UPI0036582E81
MRLRTYARTTAVALAAALALTACGGDTSADGGDSLADVSGEQDPTRGTVLDTPFAKPAITLTDTEGEPYDLVAETAGHATLLYFGYTNCPDVCPLTMSNIGNATAGLTQEQRDDLRVVFITSDPERDTPESLGPWLRAQGEDFIGLTGDFDTIQEAARSLGIHIDAPTQDEDGTWISTHGSQVLAFLPTDDKAHVIYMEGVTQDTFAADLPGLIEGRTP